MQPQKFRDLYVQKNNDLKVTTFEGVAGFSVVRNYPENTKFFKDGNLMFIRIFLKEKYVCGGIEMVSGGGHKDDRYYLIDASFYKNKITGFSFNEDENIIFDSTTSRMHNGKSKKQLSLNEFIDILVKNHLQDKLFFKRKINFIVHLFLRFIFWLVNQKYDDIKIFYNNTNPQIQNQNINKRSSEPFFKYFSISKNILFLLSILITFLLFFLGNLTKSVYFITSNPLLISIFFTFLFISEKITSLLNKKIEEFFNKKEKGNFIIWMHLFRYRNSFKLKF